MKWVWLKTGGRWDLIGSFDKAALIPPPRTIIIIQV